MAREELLSKKKVIGNVETYLIYRQRDEIFLLIIRQICKKNGLTVKCELIILTVYLKLSNSRFVYGCENSSRILADGNSQSYCEEDDKGNTGTWEREWLGVESVGTSKHLTRTQVQQAELNTSNKHKFSRQN